jgi:CheY-like chemotaxis protein
LLAGKKLLLADDSVTIQKVVDLTFADEGVTVLCVNNGKDAIDRIAEFGPDVVLADVFMPLMNGYEVCEYIKQNENLKHIPVMLLVGSFEPFDEAEARRVGADDTLTKPFQSIRRLVEKVGILVGGRQPGEAPTAELPKAEEEPEPEVLSEDEIEVTTADTQPLPAEFGHVTLEWPSPGEREEGVSASEPKVDDGTMQSTVTETSEVSRPRAVESDKGDLLLDLDYYPKRSAVASDDFLLDIDLDDVPDASPVESAFPTAEFVKQAQFKARAASWSNLSQVKVEDEAPSATEDQLATTQEFERPGVQVDHEAAFETTAPDGPVVAEPTHPGVIGETQSVSQPSIIEHTSMEIEKLSPELIDAIARRAVAQMSEKVLQEIAWEVVPQLAELLIKRQLEEKNS